MKKQDILDEIIKARADLVDAIVGLSPDQMRQAGVVGMWSVKDVLAHVVAWESELVTALDQVQNRRVPAILDIEDIDEWNDEQYHTSVRRPLEAIRDDFEQVHTMLLSMVKEIGERDLTDNRRFHWMEGEPLWYLLAENGYLHEREHAEEIRTWRAQEGI